MAYLMACAWESLSAAKSCSCQLMASVFFAQASEDDDANEHPVRSDSSLAGS